MDSNQKPIIHPSVYKFAGLVWDIIQSDRDVIVGAAGFTGSGKSCLFTKIFQAYSQLSGTYWDFDRMTWSNKELLKWIDGEGPEKTGQLAKNSGILVDELFRLFYRRLWYEKTRITTLSVLNMFRDRGLFVGGNIPNFWDLDPAFQNRVRFYIYVKERGHAWVFAQEENPFTADPWNVNENRKTFRKYKNPGRINNFVMSLYWDDWSPTEKEEYYEIRNKKRLTAEDEYKDQEEQKEKYTQIKKQRDTLILELFRREKKLTNVYIADLIGMAHQTIREIRHGR